MDIDIRRRMRQLLLEVLDEEESAQHDQAIKSYNRWCRITSIVFAWLVAATFFGLLLYDIADSAMAAACAAMSATGLLMNLVISLQHAIYNIDTESLQRSKLILTVVSVLTALAAGTLWLRHEAAEAWWGIGVMLAFVTIVIVHTYGAVLLEAKIVKTRSLSKLREELEAVHLREPDECDASPRS